MNRVRFLMMQAYPLLIGTAFLTLAAQAAPFSQSGHFFSGHSEEDVWKTQIQSSKVTSYWSESVALAPSEASSQRRSLPGSNLTALQPQKMLITALP
jgi:hypothetical protein